VVHGLWPQYQRGFPSFCQVPAPRLNRGIVNSMLDLMPSQRLVFHQWDRHGTCTGLTQQGYFDNIRKARAVIKIPQQYLDVSTALTVTPVEVRDAFIKANAGLDASGIAIDCGGKWLGEVRICLTKDYSFRDCPEVVRRTCRRDKLLMPPVRGASADAR
jgi:ribonuclease T2